MSGLYLDTSAAAKLLVEEAESRALTGFLQAAAEPIVATVLLETELRRLAARHDVEHRAVSALLAQVSLYELPPSIYREAGLLPGRDLRTLDALHLAGAVRLGVRLLIAYDHRLQASATAIGLEHVAPGAT